MSCVRKWSVIDDLNGGEAVEKERRKVVKRVEMGVRALESAMASLGERGL